MYMQAVTELDAINEILLATGQEPIISLDNMADNIDAVSAQRCLRRVLATLQTSGYTWNLRSDVTLTPDSNTKRIRWNTAWLSIKNTDDTSAYYRPKDGYVYDVVNDTFEFSSGFTAEIIREVDFDELPYCFRNYAIQRASYMFAGRVLGDATLQQLLGQDVSEAMGKCTEYELDVGGYNMYNNTSVSDGMSRS